MKEICNDDRFEIIERAKADLLRCTNIDKSPEEMRVLDNILFRCWQMGWLGKHYLWHNYEQTRPEKNVEVIGYNSKWITSDNPEGTKAGYRDDQGFISSGRREDPIFWTAKPRFTLKSSIL